MTYASPRFASIAAAVAVALFAASPAVPKQAYLTVLKLDRPSNQIAASAGTAALPVYDFFWAPSAPPPFMVDIHSYMVIPSADWSAGAPVDDGMLAAAVRTGSCQAGARYDGAKLRISDRIHYMRDVVVTGCKPLRSGRAEWMTIAFSKVD